MLTTRIYLKCAEIKLTSAEMSAPIMMGSMGTKSISRGYITQYDTGICAWKTSGTK